MAKNDVTILNNILEQRKVPELSSEDNFELFAYDQVLKDYNVSDEELLNGKIGGKYSIGLFNFINDDLISEDTDLDDIKKPSMATFLILAKTSYTETYIDYITKIIVDIFDFKKNNPDTRSFRDIYLKLVPRSTIINIVLASKEDTISSLIIQRIEGIKRLITEYMKDVNITFRMVGPGELVTLAHKEKSYTLKLRYEDLVSDGDAYFVLSTLTDYENFVTDEEGNLRRYIFDSNVRDFQKNSEVNKGIEKTLREGSKADFWWLNNGIAILAKNPTMSRGTIHLDDVQIVNGLQTTYIVHKYLDSVGEKDKRKIGIKIVTTDDPEIRDAIIKAASSQTPIPKTAMRANDDIQRNIESYLLNNDWFYDRRKNYYKNMRKQASRIISIGYLAQAITSIVYREPNKARRSPTSLTKDDKDYELLFGLSNYKIFLFCIRNMKKIDSYMRSSDHGEQYKTNLKWHLATLVMVKLLGKKEYTIKDIESIIDTTMETKIIDDTMSELVILTDMYLASHGVIFRTMSGSKEFVTYMLERLKMDK